MPLFRRNRPRFVGPGRATPEQARTELRAALARAAVRSAGVDHSRRIALVGQVTRGRDYESVRAYWLKRVPEVGRWPERLTGSDFAFNLWPVRPGAKDSAKPGRLKLIATPEFGTFDESYEPATAFAIVTATWLDTTGAHEVGPLEIADARVEIWSAGRRRHRSAVDLN